MVKEFNNYIPSFKELKDLDKKDEYIYNIVEIVGTSRLRLTYNEEFNGQISIDYLEGGFLHGIYLPICDKTDIVEGKFYKLTKQNYAKIIEFIILVKQEIIKGLNDIKWG